MALEARLVYPKEPPLFVIGVIFSALFWLLLVVSIVGIFYGLIGLTFALVSHAIFLAYVKGNGVRVSAQQFPDLYARCQKAARQLGLVAVPEIYLIQAGGALNAFATKLLNRKFVVIYSDLADQCQDPRHLDFVIGHEIGHLAAGHLSWNAFLWPFRLFPWLGPAYLRAREYTSDRCGFAVVGDLESSMRGLAVLAAGGRHASQLDLKAFMEQRLGTGGFWSAVLELNSSHPYLCKRVAALQDVHQPGSTAPVRRNPLAYPFAPIFGLAAAGTGGGMAGLLVMVALVGIIAAIAIPSLLRARMSANEAATIGDLRTVISAQFSYAGASGGVFGKSECLIDPGQCLRNYDGPALAIPAILASESHGYRRTLSLGPRQRSFAYVAVPLKVGQTGVRGFCADHTGIICWTQDGSAPRVAGGGCDLTTCKVIQ